MGCKFNFKITFTYEMDSEADLKALSISEIKEEIGNVTISRRHIEDGVATYYGIAYKVIELECILGLFEDYGYDIVVTWIEEDTPDEIDNPVLSQYVDIRDNEPRYVFAPCCGKYTSRYFERPAVVEVFGKNKYES